MAGVSEQPTQAASEDGKRGFRFEIQFAGAIHPKVAYDANFLRQLTETEAAANARLLSMLPVEELIAAMGAASALVHSSTKE